MPAILKILIVFATMLAVTRFKIHLAAALLAGGLALNLWAGIPLPEALLNLIRSFAGAELWLMIGITGIIVEIGRYMTDERNAAELVSASRRWGGRHGRAATLMALPAVVGLVPMPAGALFSAPFVAQAGSHISGREDWKASVNYWFRHVWEYWWPLYPGVIIAMATFSMVETWQYIATLILLSPVAILSGYHFLIRPHLAELSRTEAPAPGSHRIYILMLPLVLIIVAMIGLPFVLKATLPDLSEQTRKLLAVLLGLLVALVAVGADEWRAGKFRLFRALLQRKSLDVQATLIGVLIFKAMLDRSGLLPASSQELLASHIPLAVAVSVLPFLAGIVTGIALGFTGTSFPLVVGLMATPGSGLTPLATLVLAYAFGYMGMMLSPVHLCLLVTRDYFATSIAPIYRRILPCVLSIMAAALLEYAILRALGW
jgi:integral membrane protein (TIGR00529 family)